MNKKRITELLQTLWTDVLTSKDLEEFVEKYRDELDDDFIDVTASVIESATAEGEDEMARFFRVALKNIVRMTSDLPPKEDIIKAYKLLVKMGEEIKTKEQLIAFAQGNLEQFDDTFFLTLDSVANMEEKHGITQNLQFYAEMKETLLQMKKMSDAESED